MTITKILGITEEEGNTLVQAGKILKELSNTLENKEADVLDEGVADLISKINEYSSKLSTN